jgi:hypothetical protein
MNAICCLIFEGPKLSVQAVLDAGVVMLFMNAAVAFCLNVAVVFLVFSPRLHILTADRQNILSGIDIIWCPQRYPPRRTFRLDLVDSSYSTPNVRLLNCSRRINLLQNRR